MIKKEYLNKPFVLYEEKMDVFERVYARLKIGKDFDPALVQELYDVANQAFSILKKLEWRERFEEEVWCPICFNKYHKGHADDCPLGNLLK